LQQRFGALVFKESAVWDRLESHECSPHFLLGFWDPF